MILSLLPLANAKSPPKAIPVAKAIPVSDDGARINDTCQKIADAGLREMWGQAHGDMGTSGRAKIENFTQNILRFTSSAENVFEPYSGADIFYPTEFFPSMRRLIMVGEQPVGDFPVPGHGILVAHSYQALFNGSFSVTRDMNAQFKGYGIASMLCGAIAAMGNTVNSIERTGDHVTYVYGKNGAGNKTVTYYDHNLANGGITESFKSIVRGSHGIDASFLKATSYFPHGGSAENANRLVLESRMVVQSDTGVPFRYYDNSWSLSYFGVYNGPSDSKDFSDYNQPTLRTAFANAGPLNFHFDYGNKSNIIFAVHARRAEKTKK